MVRLRYTKMVDSPIKYETNPSIVPTAEKLVTKKNKVLFKNGNAALVDASTGELAGHLQRVFISEVEVDTEKFIKVYANSLDELMNLSSAGIKVFKLIYLELLNKPNIDNVTLDFNALKTLNKWEFAQSTFISGINDLTQKKIIFKALNPAQYWINIEIFFNGDRVSVIKSYRLKQQSTVDLLTDLD